MDLTIFFNHITNVLVLDNPATPVSLSSASKLLWMMLVLMRMILHLARAKATAALHHWNSQCYISIFYCIPSIVHDRPTAVPVRQLKLKESNNFKVLSGIVRCAAPKISRDTRPWPPNSNSSRHRVSTFQQWRDPNDRRIVVSFFLLHHL